MTRSPSLWEGCFNARDTGGLPAGEGVTRSGVLFRSDNLCRLTEAGLHGFAASGVETVIDVRSAYELGIDPSPFAASNTVRYLNLPLQNEDDAAAMARINSDIRLSDMYRVMLRHFGANIRGIVEAVAEADGAVVIHCHAGKDRTGLVIALLLSAVGVADDTAAEDSALSAGVTRGTVSACQTGREGRTRAPSRRRSGNDAQNAGLVESRVWWGRGLPLQSGVPDRVVARLRERLVAI